MIEHVFETIGDPIGTRSEPRYRTTLEKLLVALNVLRPASKDYLLHLLKESDRFVPETATVWTFTPPPVTTEDEEEDEEIYDDDDE